MFRYRLENGRSTWDHLAADMIGNASNISNLYGQDRTLGALTTRISWFYQNMANFQLGFIRCASTSRRCRCSRTRSTRNDDKERIISCYTTYANMGYEYNHKITCCFTWFSEWIITGISRVSIQKPKIFESLLICHYLIF